MTMESRGRLLKQKLLRSRDDFAITNIKRTDIIILEELSCNPATFCNP